MTKFYSKQTNGFYDLAVHKKIPCDAVEIDDDYYYSLVFGELAEERLLICGYITTDETGMPVNGFCDNKISNICDAIDAHVSRVIKTANVTGEPADYDSIGELALYVNSNNNTYRMEAQTLTTFVESCYAIQSDIKNGVVTFDSVDAAIAALPIV